MEEMRNNPATQEKEAKHKKKNFWKNLSPFAKNLLISAIMVLISVIILVVCLLFRSDNKTDKYNLFSIEMISELTTLECRYHNVAVCDEKGNWIGAGSRYVWFEYDVIVDVGIDINKVRIENPTEDGVVRIYLPPAEILGVAEDKATISKPVCDLGSFTDITADEERQIIIDGIQKLKNDAKTEEVILYAYNSAKNVLEQYVINVGKLIGEDYTVEWIEVAEDAQTVVGDQSTSITE